MLRSTRRGGAVWLYEGHTTVHSNTRQHRISKRNPGLRDMICTITLLEGDTTEEE